MNRKPMITELIKRWRLMGRRYYNKSRFSDLIKAVQLVGGGGDGQLFS